MWRQLRIAILLLILAIAAYSNWYDRLSTTDWDETLYIGLFPINAEGSVAAERHIARMTPASVADIEQFINGEAKRYGIGIARPVKVVLYPEVKGQPPPLERSGNVLKTMLWSLKLRMYARRASRESGRALPQVRIFMLFHDPAFNQAVPHSVGLQKGLVGVVHAYAASDMIRPNNVVVAHEILHTLGATDKYDPQTLAPSYPIGYAEPERDPVFPQPLTEIMAGRRAVDAQTFEQAETLAEVRVGRATAVEIGWLKAL